MDHQKFPVAILGATGTVGQWFVHLLANHPWFELVTLTASERSAGKTYRQACHWTVSADIPAKVADLVVQESAPGSNCRIAFSGLDASVAGTIEEAFAKAGYAVLSNARNHRLEADVPLLIPEVNPDHLNLIPIQQKKRGYQTGFIVTNPNCAVIALSLALAPLDRVFGLEEVIVSTMQAISGAGYPGHPAIDILGNIIPFISGEEEKIAVEPRKILGGFSQDHIENHPMKISASTNRVPVIDGHLGNAFVKLRNKADPADIVRVFEDFKGLPQRLKLPTAPERPIIYRAEKNRPQTRRDVMAENGMAVIVGRVQASSVLDVKFVFLGHNTIRGAAGASILNAELLKVQGYFDAFKG